MIYFYHHYELPYVLQQAQLQQVIIQRQQQQQQQHQQQHHHHHHQHQHQHQPTAGDVRRADNGSPIELTLRPVQHFSLMNGLNNLGRLRAVLLRRRRVRTFEPPPPPPPSSSTPSATNPVVGGVDGVGAAADSVGSPAAEDGATAAVTQQ